jgi:hypothetical protein
VSRISVTCRAMLTTASFALLLALAGASLAQAHTCGTNWCSGSDSSTTQNIQGNGPQEYMGEADTYQHNWYGQAGPCPSGPNDGMCWEHAGAESAITRYQASTGLGVEAYYFGGGSGVNNQGVSALCWGAKQGWRAAYSMDQNFDYAVSSQFMTFIDIEDPIADYGWNSTEQTANRDVFNGFTDYVSGADPCSLGNNSGDLAQYGVYSSPDAWNNGIGSNSDIPNTYEWTYERCCETSWLGTNWGGDFESFGSSSYDWALQFDQGPDYNDAYEPDYLPVFQETLGN